MLCHQPEVIARGKGLREGLIQEKQRAHFLACVAVELYGRVARQVVIDERVHEQNGAGVAGAHEVGWPLLAHTERASEFALPAHGGVFYLPTPDWDAGVVMVLSAGEVETVHEELAHVRRLGIQRFQIEHPPVHICLTGTCV